MKDEIKMKKEEWHYLKENPNYLPEDRENVLLLVKVDGEEVIAWKEITLPEDK